MKPIHSKYGFDFTNLKLEHKPWINFLIAPSLVLIGVYVYLKKFFYKRIFKKLPPVNTMFFDGLGKYAKQVTAKPGSWQALKLIYEQPTEKPYTISWMIDRLGFINTNCQSVRNRLAIVSSVLKQLLDKDIIKKALLIACGSADSLNTAFLQSTLSNKRINLVDSCEDAILFLNKSFIGTNIMIENYTIEDYLVTNPKEEMFDLIELVGLLEYLDDKKIKEYFSKIFDILQPGGYFITSSISYNLSTTPVIFSENVINWKMIYRTKEQLAKLTKDAGFDDFEIITEPLGIHNIVVARKS